MTNLTGYEEETLRDLIVESLEISMADFSDNQDDDWSETPSGIEEIALIRANLDNYMTNDTGFEVRLHNGAVLLVTVQLHRGPDED